MKLIFPVAHAAIVVASALSLGSSVSNAQLSQVNLYLNDGHGNLTQVSAPNGPGTLLLPGGSGTLLTTTTGLANPMTTLGDMIYGIASGIATRLPGNTTGSTKGFLTSTAAVGVAAAPVWSAIAGTDVPVFVASGASHAVGTVPDPGSTSGTTRFLREDATWATPSGGGSAEFTGNTGPSAVGSLQTGNSPTYWAPVGMAEQFNPAAITDGNVMIVARSGTIKNFYVTLSAKTGSSSNYWTFTIVDVTASTNGPTVNVGGTSFSANDISTTTFSVTAGDLISIYQTYHGTPGNSPSAVWAFELQ